MQEATPVATAARGDTVASGDNFSSRHTSLVCSPPYPSFQCSHIHEKARETEERERARERERERAVLNVAAYMRKRER
jgi:hypothetical protein